MSDLVIRAPVVRLLVPPRKAEVTVDPPSTTEAAQVTTGAGPARSWRLPEHSEHDDDLDTRASLGRVSGWFLPQG
jgi:hypothetical protein